MNVEYYIPEDGFEVLVAPNIPPASLNTLEITCQLSFSFESVLFGIQWYELETLLALPCGSTITGISFPSSKRYCTTAYCTVLPSSSITQEILL